jgi:hypothetical protein
MFFFLTLVINCILSQLLQKLIALHSILLTSRKKRKILFSECTGLWGTGTLYLCVAKIRQNNVFHSTNCVAHTMALCRWEIIAGRIPGRTAEEVEMFWSKKHQERWNRGLRFISIIYASMCWKRKPLNWQNWRKPNSIIMAAPTVIVQLGHTDSPQLKSSLLFPSQAGSNYKAIVGAHSEV